MSPDRLRQIIQQGENLDVEFKGERQRQLSDDEIVRAVVRMANRASEQSGWVIIGVEDDGQLTGAQPRHGTTTDPLRLQALIANRTRPSLSVQVYVAPLQPEGVEIIAIEVPPVHIPVGTADGVYLRRAIGGEGKPECLPMHFHDMQSLQATRGLLDHSAVIVEGATWDDLDPLEFERFRRFVRESRGQGDEMLLELSDEELAKALGAVEANHAVARIRVLGLLLFGKEAALRRFLPTHEVAFQALRGERVEVNEFFRYPLLRVIEGVVERTGRGVDIIFTEQLRNGRPAPSYERSTPTDVVLVLPGGQANLAFVRLVVEENQAGRLLRLDELLLLNALWQERSLTTAQAAKLLQKSKADARAALERLVEAGLVEGRGERKGRTYHLSAATCRRLGAPSAYVRRRGFEPIQCEQMILQYVRAHGRITRREAAELCQLKECQAFYILQKLVKQGRLKSIGKGRGAYYELASGNA
ncbi:RNA-binding domain-containing protein [Thermoflexus hugenholtzii]